MSEDSDCNDNNEAGPSCCGCVFCGIAEIDDIKLKDCDLCDLVKYCTDECRKNHRLEHQHECKKRAGELRDELLFKQPESNHNGDCPICCLPLSLEMRKSSLMTCCSKVICNGCTHASFMMQGNTFKCPFCREHTGVTKEESDKQNKKRAEEANDPVAMSEEARIQHVKGDFISAFEYSTKAAILGQADAHFLLARMYYEGHGVETDRGKGKYHLEEAAIGGHPRARHNLGVYEWGVNNNIERAVKHWIIAAAQGFDDSTKILMKKFREGYVSKEELAAALRAHQAAVNETKSDQREEAAGEFDES